MTIYRCCGTAVVYFQDNFLQRFWIFTFKCNAKCTIWWLPRFTQRFESFLKYSLEVQMEIIKNGRHFDNWMWGKISRVDYTVDWDQSSVPAVWTSKNAIKSEVRAVLWTSDRRAVLHAKDTILTVSGTSQARNVKCFWRKLKNDDWIASY